MIDDKGDLEDREVRLVLGSAATNRIIACVTTDEPTKARKFAVRFECSIENSDVSETVRTTRKLFSLSENFIVECLEGAIG